MISYRSALILGGARSGKSRFAQATVEAASKQRVFIATAQAFDDEMQRAEFPDIRRIAMRIGRPGRRTSTSSMRSAPRPARTAPSSSIV